MRKQFMERIERECIVDTKKYRYILGSDNYRVSRIRMEQLDTTDALSNSGNWKKIR